MKPSLHSQIPSVAAALLLASTGCSSTSGTPATENSSSGGVAGGVWAQPDAPQPPTGGAAPVATGGAATGGSAAGGSTSVPAPLGGSSATGGSGGFVASGGGGTAGVSTGGNLALAGSAPTAGATTGGAASGGASNATGGMAGSSPGGAVGPAAGGTSTPQATTIWIAGDSTVADGTTPCPSGWGKHFAPYFDDQVTVANRAVSGRSVRTWLYEVTSAIDDSTGECILTLDSSGNPVLQARWVEMLEGMRAGDYLLVQFGINDSGSTCERHVGLEAFRESYGMMAQAAKDRGAQPVFITPVSAISCSEATAVGTRGSYVDATLEAGTEFDVPVIDLHALSIALYNDRGFCPIPGGDASAGTAGDVGDFFCDDHNHFSDAGAFDIAGLVAQAMGDQGGALGDHLLESAPPPVEPPPVEPPPVEPPPVEPPATEPITVFVAGDSTVSTYTETPSPNDQAGWGQMLHEQYGELVTVDNRAQGGRTALWFALEGRVDSILADASAGDYLLVQFGTNDSHKTAEFTVDGVTYKRFAAWDGAFQQHLRDEYVIPARDNGLIPVLVTPPPRNSAYCTGGNSLANWAQGMRDLSAAEGVDLVDLNVKTVTHLQAICPSPTPEDFFLLRADGSVDGTHFQEHGARVLAGFVADGIGEAGLGLDAYRL